jgi:hypothetical protein
VKKAVLPNLKNMGCEAILDLKQLLDAHIDDDIEGDGDGVKENIE